MNRFHLLSLFCFIAAVVLFIVSAFSGDLKSGIVVVFPFIAGSGPYAFFGVLLVFLALLFFIFGFTRTIPNSEDLTINEDEKPKVKGGGIILIGPIPIVFGSSLKVALVFMILALFLILILVLFLGII